MVTKNARDADAEIPREPGGRFFAGGLAASSVISVAAVLAYVPRGDRAGIASETLARLDPTRVVGIDRGRRDGSAAGHPSKSGGA